MKTVWRSHGDVPWPFGRFAARPSALASGLALAVRRAGLAGVDATTDAAPRLVCSYGSDQGIQERPDRDSNAGPTAEEALSKCGRTVLGVA
jgi:hypothetical protein